MPPRRYWLGRKLLQLIEASLIEVAQGCHHIRFRRTQRLEGGRPLEFEASPSARHGDGRPVVRQRKGRGSDRVRVRTLPANRAFQAAR